MVHHPPSTGQAAVLTVLHDAFADDPLISWLFPDTTTRADLQTALYFRPLLAHPAAEADLVQAGSGEPAGASIWLHLAAGEPPYGSQPQAHPGDARGRQGDPGDTPLDLPGDSQRLRALGAELAPRHPHDQAYIYLPCMAVTPAHRGLGLGSEMLERRLRWADSLALGTYLEASSPRSRALYLRHGFHDRGAPIQLADSPALWPMWRPTTKTGVHR
ncbi:GNAT superfamily N-acetyltransferase [Kribbella aluminosa]|uniref:GNAT superfamily N-acetyltransferase n=1 Tax=Kribbella aluminosa TaxID=416017 RepID=A0ABS4UMX4_9ACTN|nr:GNAT family N-acetyltransferase [Kribbella aluminosa]MBP2353002.1 GNAT superfamily N-acetyltransferase [Kribbella aluminosa]